MNPINVTLGGAPAANPTAVGMHPMQHMPQQPAMAVGGNAVASLLRAGMQQLGTPMATAEDIAKMKALADSMGGVLFDKISIKGSKWTLNCNGQVAVNHPMPNLEVIIVDIARYTSREYYDKPYTPGEKVKPACWSDNGLAPHPSVPAETRQSSRCDTCAMNQKGSRKRVTDKEGSATGVACGFFRRIVVVPQVQGYSDKAFALDLPSSSLWERENGPYGTGLENYVKGVLSANGIVYDMLVTNLCFDPTAEMPKVLFNPAWKRDVAGNPVAPIFLNEQQRAAIKQMADSDAVKKMLEVSDVNYETDIPALPAPVQQQQQLLAAPVQQQSVNIGGGSATPVQVVAPVQQEEMVNVEGHGLMTRSQYNALVAQHEAAQAAAQQAAVQPQEEMVNVEGHGLMTRSQYNALVAQHEAAQAAAAQQKQQQEEMVNVEGHGLMTRSQYNALVEQFEAQQRAEEQAAAQRAEEQAAAQRAAEQAAAAKSASNVTVLPGVSALPKPTTAGAAPVAGLAVLAAPAGQTGVQPLVSAAQPAKTADLGNVQGAATLTTLAAPVGLPNIGTVTPTTSLAAATAAPAVTVAATATSTQAGGASALPVAAAGATGEMTFDQVDGLSEWLGNPNAQA